MDQPTTDEVRRGHEIARALVTLRIEAKADGQSPAAMADLREWINDAAGEVQEDRPLLLATLGALASLTAVVVDLLAQSDGSDPAQVFQAIAARAVATDFTW